MAKTLYLYTDLQMEEIQNFITEKFGDDDGYVSHEIVSEYVHTDSVMVSPEGERRAAEKHKKHAMEVTAMDLPVDFESAFREDFRANIHCDSVSDALLLSIDALGMADIEFIASVTDEEMKTVIEKLKGAIYQNPLHWNECWYKGWETADEYLSGNLLHKYHLAKEADEQYLGYFEENVKALEALIGPGVAVDDIYVTIGSPWVPTDVIDDFILHLIGLDRYENGVTLLSEQKFAEMLFQNR